MKSVEREFKSVTGPIRIGPISKSWQRVLDSFSDRYVPLDTAHTLRIGKGETHALIAFISLT